MTGEAPAFARTIGIDYFGAETANSSLKGFHAGVFTVATRASNMSATATKRRCPSNIGRGSGSSKGR